VQQRAKYNLLNRQEALDRYVQQQKEVSEKEKIKEE